MRALLLAALATIAVASSACSTIYFTNGKELPSEEFTAEKWHHVGILALIEFSDPVDLAYRCEGMSWKSVRTQKSFWNGLAQIAANLIGPIYEPWTVGYTCGKKPI